MSITPDTSITLGIHEPKKDAVVASGAPSAGADDVSIWIGSAVNGNLVQSIVGDLHKLHRFAQSNLATFSGDTALEIPLGGSDNEISVGSPSPVTAGSVLLALYTGVIGEQRSHFIDRTFKRLIERLLEEAK